MSTPNRASKITKAHKVLKKHYKPYVVADRPILEHLLYACCLQSATHEAADEAFAKLQQAYYDWNEVRVTTISELAEVMNCLPQAGGNRVTTQDGPCSRSSKPTTRSTSTVSRKRISANRSSSWNVSTASPTSPWRS